jgi:hypothetical protein
MDLNELAILGNARMQTVDIPFPSYYTIAILPKGIKYSRPNPAFFLSEGRAK